MEQGARRAGFILVGGRSSRMGSDKALLPYGGATLVEHVAAAVQTAAGSVTLVGHPERYRGLPYRVISDLSPELGPLGGLEAALSHTRAQWNLITACDMPGLNAEFLGRLLNAAECCGALCLAPVSPGGRVEPLCAAWRRDSLPGIRRAIAHGISQMREVVAALEAVQWPVAEARWFENLNTRQDWARYGTAGQK